MMKAASPTAAKKTYKLNNAEYRIHGRGHKRNTDFVTECTLK